MSDNARGGAAYPANIVIGLFGSVEACIRAAFREVDRFVQRMNTYGKLLAAYSPGRMEIWGTRYPEFRRFADKPWIERIRALHEVGQRVRIWKDPVFALFYLTASRAELSARPEEQIDRAAAFLMAA